VDTAKLLLNEHGLAQLRSGWGTLIRRPETGLAGLLLIISLILSLRTNTFLTPDSIFNILRAFSWIAVAAFGEALVLIIGGIDLSVGAVMALAGIVSALVLQAGANVSVAVGAGLLAAALVGLANGSAISTLKLPPFIVTLATMSVVRGLVFGLARGWPLRDLPEGYRRLGQSALSLGQWSVPVPVLIMLGLALLVTLLLRYTVLGRYIYTLGRSESALLVSGVDVEYIRRVVYTLSGLLAGMGGIMMTARLGVAAPTAATGYELDVIAAAIIGGASLFGGEGNVLGVMLGAVLMQVLRSGVVLLDFPVYWQQTAMGALILAAIVVDRRLHRHSEGT
jgi:ribose transport system permease protein